MVGDQLNEMAAESSAGDADREVVNSAYQSWLTKRLMGLTPADFVSRFRLLCTMDLAAPDDFKDAWFTCKSPGVAAALHEEALLPFGPDEVILIFCDPSDNEQIDLVTQILTAMDRLEDDAPATLLLPHTAFRNADAAQATDNTNAEGLAMPQPNLKTLVANIVELGLRDFLVGEPEGFNLALVVRSKIEVMAAIRARVFNDLVVRRELLHKANFFQQSTNRLLWEYLRVRLDTCIPPVDARLEAGLRPQLPGFTFGRLIGEGSFGKVYSLTDAAGVTQAVKVIRKRSMRQFNDVLQMNRMIKVMNKLCEQRWNHPGIVQLHQVYHSTSYFLFRMEYGGRENLLQRIQRRDVQGPRRAALSETGVSSIIRQTVNVVAFLHTGPQIYHRDINPANFVVAEEADGFAVKLVDFEFAMFHDGKTRSTSRCGTLPFIAPEVFLEDTCDWFAADVWSLGMTILEVNSRAQLFETILRLDAADFRQQAAVATLQTVRAVFAAPGSAETVLKDMCREELEPMLPFVTGLAADMLKTDATLRVKAPQVASKASRS